MIKDSEVEGYLIKISEQLKDVCIIKKEISKMMSLYSYLLNTTSEPPKTKLLSTKEAAKYLNITPNTIYRKFASGEIKGYKAAGLKFKISDLDDYLLGKCSKTKQEIINEANDFCLKNSRK